jgi:hypothetical protein
VRVRVIDKLARKQYEVEPRAFEGRLLHQLPPIRTPYGEAYAELYLAQPGQPGLVALTRSGTRVVEHLASLPGLEDAPLVVATPAGADRRAVPQPDAGNQKRASSTTSATPPCWRR